MQKNLSLTQGQLGLFVYVVVVAVFLPLFKSEQVDILQIMTFSTCYFN